MLDSDIKQQLKSYFESLVNPVELTLSADQSSSAQELTELAREINELSDKITLNENGNNKRVPALEIAPKGESPRITFCGVPMGHEFSSLVLALLQSGGHPAKEEAALLEQIKQIKGEFHFETYISLSCQNCPVVVQALNLMSLLNPNISHTMIDGGVFQEEVEEKNIMAVPTVYLNGEPFDQGRMSLGQIVKKIDTEADAHQAQSLEGKDPFDVLIVGGGPAGAAAAIYAARKGIRTGVVAERFGGQVLDTNAIENFISVSETDGPKLAAGLEEHVREYDVDIMNEERAVKLSRNDMVEVALENGATLKSRAVIIATGARWRELGVPGEREYRGHGVGYCVHCDGPLFKGKPVAVVGGGNSGIEAAIDLAGFVEHVTVLEYGDSLKADEVLIEKAQSFDNVTILTGAATTEITGDGTKLNGLTYTDRESGESRHLELAGVFVQIGLVPNTEWLKGDLELTKYGEIEVNPRGETSMKGVFAAGDVTTSPYNQIIIAMGSGATAALSSFDYLIREPKA